MRSDGSPGTVAAVLTAWFWQPPASSRITPGLKMVPSAEVIVKERTVPRGTPARATVSGAGACVGPMMKLPRASGEGSWPSGSSVAAG